jgi:hypothetical protein
LIIYDYELQSRVLFSVLPTGVGRLNCAEIESIKIAYDRISGGAYKLGWLQGSRKRLKEEEFWLRRPGLDSRTARPAHQPFAHALLGNVSGLTNMIALRAVGDGLPR